MPLSDAARRCSQHDGQFASDERFAAAINFVEQFIETLPFQFRQGLADRFTCHIATADERHILRVGEFVDMFRPAKDCHETGSLRKQVPEKTRLGRQFDICGINVFAFNAQRAICLAQLLLANA